MLKLHSVLISEVSLVPSFGIINDILVFDVDKYYIVLEELHTDVYCHHYHAYEVSRICPRSFFVCEARNLLEHSVLELHENLSKLYVLLKYNIIEKV